MTLLATQPKPHPADPNKPWPGPNPGPNVWAMARPDDMPVPTTPAPPPPPTPRPGISLRIGHAPRLPRRERTARLLNTLGRYALAWGAVGWACFWIGDVHLFVPGMVLAAMVANPWRPKKQAVGGGVTSPVLAGRVHSLRRLLVGRAGLSSRVLPRAT